jgi:hypothetical protein
VACCATESCPACSGCDASQDMLTELQGAAAAAHGLHLAPAGLRPRVVRLRHRKCLHDTSQPGVSMHADATG